MAPERSQFQSLILSLASFVSDFFMDFANKNIFLETMC